MLTNTAPLLDLWRSSGGAATDQSLPRSSQSDGRGGTGARSAQCVRMVEAEQGKVSSAARHLPPSRGDPELTYPAAGVTASKGRDALNQCIALVAPQENPLTDGTRVRGWAAAGARRAFHDGGERRGTHGMAIAASRRLALADAARCRARLSRTARRDGSDPARHGVRTAAAAVVDVRACAGARDRGPGAERYDEVAASHGASGRQGEEAAGGCAMVRSGRSAALTYGVASRTSRVTAEARRASTAGNPMCDARSSRGLALER